MCRINVIAIATLAVSVAAHGEPRPSRLIGQLADCGKVPEHEARLACYEAAARALSAAEARGDVVVVDREQAGEMRRQAFGFALPSLNLFDRGAAPEAIDRVDGKLAVADRDPNGRWTFRLDGGGAWTQVDSDMVMAQPRTGMAVTIRKSPMGAYFLSLAGHAGVRVRRVQ